MSGLRLVSVNIERSRHLDRIIPFLGSTKPDVLCVQELEAGDIEAIEQACGLRAVFCPFGILGPRGAHPHDNMPTGVGIFARAHVSSRAVFYKGSEEGARTPTKQSFTNCAVLSLDCAHEGDVYRIATTHFTWVNGGGVSDEQREDLSRMFPVLESLQEFVLTGDFNAPRGRELFSAIAERYHDNVPREYTTSIDGSLHRAGPLPYMVDGLFTTPGYEATNVRLEDGVSDHMAIVARIHKK